MARVLHEVRIIVTAHTGGVDSEIDRRRWHLTVAEMKTARDRLDRLVKRGRITGYEIREVNMDPTFAGLSAWLDSIEQGT